MLSPEMFGIRVSGAINLEPLIYNKDETGKHLQRELLIPLEVSLDHLLVTPPSHFMTQKVKDFVGRFVVNER